MINFECLESTLKSIQVCIAIVLLRAFCGCNTKKVLPKLILLEACQIFALPSLSSLPYYGTFAFLYDT